MRAVLQGNKKLKKDRKGLKFAEQLKAAEPPQVVAEPDEKKRVRFKDIRSEELATSVAGLAGGLNVLNCGYGNVCLLTEKERPGLSAIGHQEWVEIEITIDSGACDTVMPEAIRPHISMLAH